MRIKHLAFLVVLLTWTARYKNKDCREVVNHDEYSGQEWTYLDFTHTKEMRKTFHSKREAFNFFNSAPGQMVCMDERFNLRQCETYIESFVPDITTYHWKIFVDGELMYKEQGSK